MMSMPDDVDAGASGGGGVHADADDADEDERRVDVVLKPAGGFGFCSSGGSSSSASSSSSGSSGSPNDDAGGSSTSTMDFRVRSVRRSATVRALKDAVRAGYEGHPEPERVVLIYGGKVLRDEDVIGDALTIGATGAAAYGYDVDGDDVSEDDGGVAADARGDGETNGSGSERRGTPRRRTREYVLHMMIRKDPREIEEEEARAREKAAETTRREDGGDAPMADASVSTPLRATPSAAPTTPRQSTEASMDPGTPAVFASSAPRTPSPSYAPRAADSARFTLPTTPEFQSAIADAMRAAQQSPRHLPVEVAASPLMNATYHAAYHAAFAALSPNGTPPGPPPLAGLRSYLDVPQAAATGARSEHDERARRREERQERQQLANGLPPELNIPPGARVRVIHIRIDLKLIIKLAMMVFFLSQDASPLKVTMYVAMAVFVYLQQTGALAPVLRWLTGNDNIGRGDENQRGGNRQGGNGAAANGNRAPNAANDAQRYAVPTRVTRVAGHTTMPQTYFGEVKIFIYSLFASLFPSWLPPRLHEAGRQAAPRREHQD